MLVCSGPLALETCSRPISDILVNARPYVPRGDQPLSSSNNRVRKGSLGHQTPGGGTEGDQWVGGPCGCVTEECGIAGWYWDP